MFPQELFSTGFFVCFGLVFCVCVCVCVRSDFCGSMNRTNREEAL